MNKTKKRYLKSLTDDRVGSYMRKSPIKTNNENNTGKNFNEIVNIKDYLLFNSTQNQSSTSTTLLIKTDL